MLISRTPVRCFVASALAIVVSTFGAVQLVADDGLVVQGTYSQRLKPQSVRLLMFVEAQGKDPKDAIKRLAEHKEKVRKELVAMKAIESSIEFRAPTVEMFTPGMPAQMQQYGRMRAMQMRAQMLGGAGAAAPDAESEEDKLPEIALAKSSLKVDWQLPTTDLDALAIVPKSLKEQVIQRDIAGKKNKIELDEEAQEKIDESMAMMREQMGYYQDEDQSDAIQVLFVATVGTQDSALGTKGAFSRAVEQSKILAEAGGLKLGKLRGVSSNRFEDPTSASLYSSYQAAAVAANASTAVVGYKPGIGEVTNLHPEGLEMEYQVTLTYEIGE